MPNVVSKTWAVLHCNFNTRLVEKYFTSELEGYHFLGGVSTHVRLTCTKSPSRVPMPHPSFPLQSSTQAWLLWSIPSHVVQWIKCATYACWMSDVFIILRTYPSVATRHIYYTRISDDKRFQESEKQEFEAACFLQFSCQRIKVFNQYNTRTASTCIGPWEVEQTYKAPEKSGSSYLQGCCEKLKEISPIATGTP